MELLMIVVPVIHVSCLTYPALYVLSLDIPILLVSVLPKESRNVLMILICLAMEMTSLSIILAWGIYSVFMVISFVLAFKDSADLAINKITR